MIQCLGGVSEACGKLEEDACELVRLSQRQDTGFELFGLGGRPIALLVRELLPGFDGKFKVGRRAFRPTLRSFGCARAIERGVDFDSIEITRVELQFISLRQRVKDTSP